MNSKGLRVHVFLADKGIGSRRFCEDLIRKNLVRINGSFAKLGDKVFLGDRVKCKDQIFVFRRVSKIESKIYIALHKPKNYLCSNFDPNGRKLAISLVQPLFKERLFSVGRLDFKSSGLLLFTNDGWFANGILHPMREVEKEYIVESKKAINEDLLINFKRGVKIEREIFKLKSYVMLGDSSVRLVLTEGKNREIRKVFLSKNIFLKKIHRIRIGNIKLDNLKEGQIKVLSLAKINRLKAQLLGGVLSDNSN
ncbi:Ribosomal large subunit pseudouridine synthase B [Borrelia miyamotoi]|uniref:Pseudouridine synthase n=1 Tax=Borrelia miyamotoi TaxID=47466 RepID=A0AAP9CG26_9SPIR|nr:pseudouridine synthase [Borrelia miyamotoi]ATQ15050.2 pseudouridine synthase [Borrelia miyamotoi]ATQ16233.2 pseudouridine synthase [Borrelia miyamotoi]ATQ17377.2 pseudouridine synthase [Borrelia miyamotoi]ATQ18121.2 pseudouridine synthase [Borrelia miyamotoi]ATQ19872.2 pseudouridine synthase [Borrelia miyamotoi]